MTRMNYDRNHSRSLSGGRRYYGDEPVYVSCIICGDRQPADGHHAVRAVALRGVKARIGYRGPSQVWVCRDCGLEYGRAVTHDLVDEFVREGAAWSHKPEVPEATEESDDRSFWVWALVAGAAALIGAAFLA